MTKLPKQPAGLTVILLMSLILVSLATLPSAAQDLPGRHPGYLHALTDLRTARWLLSHQPGDQRVYADEDVAIQEIEAAIREIKHASIDDGKDLRDHPPIDVNMRPDGRFRKALELLDKAHNDTARAEDVPEARGLRDRAIGHIDRAHGTVDDAIRRVHWEEWHGM